MQKNAEEHSDFLPIVGPATSFFYFPSKDPVRVLRELHGDDRLFAETEIASARCDFVRVRELFGELSKSSSRYALASLRFGVVAAIGLGDLRFLDAVLLKMAQFRASVMDDPKMCFLADIVDSWLKRWLWLPTGYPDWILRFDIADLPQQWRPLAAYLGAMARLNAGQFESAYATAALLMNFDATVGESESRMTAGSAYLRIARAIACRETGRLAEMRKWLSGVVHELAPHGFLMPFLIFMHSSRKSPVEELLVEVAPGEIPRYRELSRTYFVNLIRARNHLTGERTTDLLSYREFYLAMLLKRKISCKELAERFDLSTGRIKNILSNLYQKLQIHSRSQIDELVW